MDDPIENFWKIRLAEVGNTLEANNFDVFIADNIEKARRVVLEEIMPDLPVKTVSWGGSVTFTFSGLYEDRIDCECLLSVRGLEPGEDLVKLAAEKKWTSSLSVSAGAPKSEN